MRIFALVCCLQFAVGGCASVPSHPSSGDAAGRLELLELRSEVFGNSRTLRVWLPPGYDGGAKAYPALYLNDGQSLFDRSTSQFSGDQWLVDESAARLIQDSMIAPVIVVGIDNAGKRNRPKEYLPWEDVHLSPPEPSPRGQDYPRFLFEEVIPVIEQRYRVLADREHRYLGGASYGGLIAVYTAAQRPHELTGLLVETFALRQ
ncbi:MAG: hypothetical protein GEU90_03075 [Gemmatimonas sp.]|nr:hypothetical protein [Gemmatimonas sp.]